MNVTRAPLGEFTEWVSGGTPSRSISRYWQGSIPWISASTLKSTEISQSDQQLTREGVQAGSRMAPVGATLLLVRGSALHNEIRAGLVTRPVCFNQDVKALIPDERVEPKFLTYSLLARSQDLLKLVSTASNSTGVLDTNLLQAFEIRLPPVPEQRAIVDALSEVDTLVNRLSGLISKKRNRRLAVKQELLTGKTRLSGFSGEWDRKTFGELFQFLATASNPRSDLSPAGDVLYVHYGDIHTRWSHHLDFASASIPYVLADKVEAADFLRDGDLIVADASEDQEGVGKCVEVRGLDGRRAVAGLHTHLLRDRNGYLAPLFGGYLMDIPEVHRAIQRVATGLKVYGISKSVLREVEVPLPSVPEQQAIAEVLTDMDAEIAAIEDQRDKVAAIRKGMMQELLTSRTRLDSSTPELATTL